MMNDHTQHIRAGILGGAGYTGGELVRLLLQHPETNIAFVHSRSHAGQQISSVHTDLLGDTTLCFVGEADWEIDVLFLCMGHGKSAEYLNGTSVPDGIHIIDLSRDFRLSDDTHDFVYGLPEYNRDRIRNAHHIANPGCFATAIQLGLLPLADAHLLAGDIQVSAITGSTGAGQSPSPTTHFSWRSNNISVYKPFRHQHLPEIIQGLQTAQPQWNSHIKFIPFRGDFSRGILAAIQLDLKNTLDEILEIYQAYYSEHPFVFVSEKNPDIKMVVNTNKGIIGLEKDEDTLLIVSVIDNLIKGASGQAIQNMNLMFGLEETTGLQLKASAF